MLTPTSDSAWRPLKIALPLIIAPFLLSSCVSGGDEPSEPDEASSESGSPGGGEEGGSEGDPLAVSTATSMEYGTDLQISVNSLERQGDDTVVARLTAANLGEDTIVFDQAMTGAPGTHRTPNGVTLIDTVNRERYFPLFRAGEDVCLCTNYEDSSRIDSGGSLDFWVAFPAPPEDIASVVVSTPVTPDFLNVPISATDQVDEEVADAEVEEPRILPISAFQDDLDGDSSREESGDETSILLASDVLFDTNESELTSASDDALEQVASEIDNSSGETVRIDGYTDNTGNDSINEPLSEDRAESVRDRLEELVTREGVTFEVDGHGSADPVADNATEDGRQKNRRVTVTFEK
jgi:outer membrane protein OmpA-like peptidoglycan-associated protein